MPSEKPKVAVQDSIHVHMRPLLNALGLQGIKHGLCMGLAVMAARSLIIGQFSAYWDRLTYLEENRSDVIQHLSLILVVIGWAQCHLCHLCCGK